MRLGHIRTTYQLATTVFVCALLGALYASNWLAQDPQAVDVMERAGYLGVTLLGIVAGLNALIPIPAATFANLYSAAGLSTIGIVIALALGTLIADLIGFWVGSKFSESAQTKYDFIKNVSRRIAASKHLYIWLFVFFYAAFVPFPNEAMVIPLAIAGVGVRHILLPLILGGLLHQTILVYGVTAITQLL